MNVGKILLLAGGVLILLGLLWLLGEKLGLGRLPGDLHWEGEHFQIYLPLASGLLLSVLLTLLLWFWRWWQGDG
jgi:hypothetical protein